MCFVSLEPVDISEIMEGYLKVLILGTRGIPATHGGFETFAEQLSIYLTARGHEVTVYCQGVAGQAKAEDYWQGIRRVLIPAGNGPLGTMYFDLLSVIYSLSQPGIVLTLGYNTALFSALYRLTGKRNVMNMDGIEWKRDKWSRLQRIWLWVNEWLGAKFANHLIADHPEIKTHLIRHTRAEKITVIPYTADSWQEETNTLAEYGLRDSKYFLVVARPEPENSLLEIVRAHASQKSIVPMVILGNYNPSINAYHKLVKEAASDNVLFLGAIYDKDTVRSLRRRATAYIHGHRVGGTNPSLVESLACGSPIIAQDNPYNRWVAGPGSRFFKNELDLAAILEQTANDPTETERMRHLSRNRFEEEFDYETVLGAYEKLLKRFSKS